MNRNLNHMNERENNSESKTLYVIFAERQARFGHLVLLESVCDN